MNDTRPDPDTLLKHVRKAEAKAQRGKLKIFLGACAGVGKTYAMLDAAARRRAEGFEAVVGIAETHGRAETERMLAGLEVLPPRWIEYRGTRLREFDLDGALARRPSLLLVDELAHTNAPGCSHAKRWQDVEALLDAGIDVYTTVNVQHLESQNDVVAQVTGVVVRETVPDAVFERAHEIELIDLPPDDLLQRFREGKVYVPDQANLAAEHFFKMGNLIALRQLALRCTADRVDRQMQEFRHVEAIREPWPVSERILVCVSPSPQSAQVVRAAKRLANRLHAPWIALYVETPRAARLPQEDRQRVLQHLRLAEDLGAETVTYASANVTEAVVAYARDRNVTKIVVGKPIWRSWRDVLFGSQVDQLARRSGNVDVYVIRGEDGQNVRDPLPTAVRTSPTDAYLKSALVVAICTGIACLALHYLNLSPVNLVMVYLAGVVMAAVRYGRGPSLLASFLSVAAFDFFLIRPYYTFAVEDTEYVLTFAVMLAVALVISGLAVRVRQQAESAIERERRTSVLYAMSRELTGAGGVDEIAAIATRHIAEFFRAEVTLWLPDERRKVTPIGKTSCAQEAGAAQWVFDFKQRAGRGTSTLPGSDRYFLPMLASNHAVGVLELGVTEESTARAASDMLLLEALVAQTAAALERQRLAMHSNQARVEIEMERLRNALLSSVSHDLRTPLSAIKGASSLLESAPNLDETLRHELIEGIHEEADYINKLVGNLLEMTRLEAGAIKVKKEWQPLEEVIGAVTTLLESRLSSHSLRVEIPADLPLVPIDAVLIQQVLFNLLENAIKYTPPSTEIELSAQASAQEVTVAVADHGPGLSAGDEARIFDKFYRAHTDKKRGGVGLGLTICKGVVSIHGGRIWAENRPGGGMIVRFTIPLEGDPPAPPTHA